MHQITLPLVLNKKKLQYKQKLGQLDIIFTKEQRKLIGLEEITLAKKNIEGSYKTNRALNSARSRKTLEPPGKQLTKVNAASQRKLEKVSTRNNDKKIGEIPKSSRQSLPEKLEVSN